MVAQNTFTDNAPDELKRRINLREFIAGDIGKLVRKGAAVRSPLRPDTKPSFVLYDNGWKDWGTGESGDVFDYVMRRDSVDFPAAVRIVSEWEGNPSTRPIYTLPAASLRQGQTADWQTAAQAILKASQRRLWHTPRILHYLRDGRGQTDETIRAESLGYNPEWTATTYINPDTGKSAWLAPGIVIPTYDAQGQLCGLRVRTHTGSFAAYLGRPDDTNRDGEPLAKYLNLAGSRLSGWMMNANKVTPGCMVLMVEGEFDAILASQLLPGVVVVTLGAASNHLTDEHAALLRTADKVYTALDNDRPGQEATAAITAHLDNVTVLRLPAGKDVTDYVVQQRGDLAAWWAATQRFSWFPGGMWDSARSGFLNFFPPTVAPVIEMLNDSARAGLLNLKDFSIPEAKKANTQLNRGCSPASIERVIKGYPDLFSSGLEISIRDLPISNPDENPGRPSKRYCAVPLTQLLQVLKAHAAPRIYEKHHPIKPTQAILAKFTAAMLADEPLREDTNALADELNEALKPAYRQQGNVEQFASVQAQREFNQLVRSLSDHTSTPLPDGWPAADYAAAFFHVYPVGDEGMSRKEIRQTFGVSNGSIKTLTERAGLKPVERYELRILSTAHDLEQQVTQGRRELGWKAYPKRLVCSTRHGKKITREYEPNDPDAMQEFAASHLKDGGSVAIEYQLKNTFEVVRETPPEPKERRAAEEASEPKIESEPAAPTEPRHYGKTYNPAWIKAQLVYALHLLGRLQDDEAITVDGEIVTLPNTITGLIELVLGRPLRTGDSLIDFARSELGAVIDYEYRHA